MIPSVEEFPYAIRVVSEVVSSNGSTSQGSVCGSTLALMDAGVPIKRPVAGISCGLISDQETGQWRTFTDIQGSFSGRGFWLKSAGFDIRYRISVAVTGS